MPAWVPTWVPAAGCKAEIPGIVVSLESSGIVVSLEISGIVVSLVIPVFRFPFRKKISVLLRNAEY